MCAGDVVVAVVEVVSSPLESSQLSLEKNTIKIRLNISLVYYFVNSLIEVDLTFISVASDILAAVNEDVFYLKKYF